MPTSRKRNQRKLERHVFGITVLDASHPEVRRLRREGAEPSLHGQKVWRSSFLLMDYLERHGLDTRARVLELGCGWGLVGIYCAKMFGACVTGLDADAAVFPYLDLHAQHNGVHIDTRQMAFEHLQPEELGTFDLLVGADICFWDELVDPLYHLVRHSVKAGVQEILVADPGRPPFDDLCARCEKSYNAQVHYWETTTPFSTSGRILRVLGDANQVQ